MNQLSIRQHRNYLSTFQRLGDGIIIGSTLYLGQWLVGKDLSDRTYLTILAAILLYTALAEATGLYRGEKCRTADSEISWLTLNWGLTLCALSILSFFTHNEDSFARSSILVWIVLAGSGLGLLRMLLRISCELLFKNGISKKRCAIAGLNALGVQLAENTQNNPISGWQIVGFFDDRQADRLHKPAATLPQHLGGLEKLVQSARAGEFDTVFITLPMRAESRIRWLLDELADSTTNAYIVPDFFVFEMLHSRWTQINGLPVVSVFETPLYGVDGWCKRVFDFFVAGIGLIAISPIMLTCALLVKLSSPGPVFFRQKRYGLDGKEIYVWKFRSMRVCDNGPVVKQATRDDPRITPIGRILRKTSLDELPQLFNVLDGSMSLVGPRPHASAHNEHYRKLIRGYMLRHKVKPGITGLAQVEGFRGETETLDKMQGRVNFDHRYIREWSLWLDFKILVRTLFVIFKQENAY